MAQFSYNGLSKSSGIYVIFNNHNWRIYVGSCKEFKNRWTNGHFKSLLRNKHHNKFLQADFNKCKKLLEHDDFLEFHVIEHMPNSTKEQRLEVEEKWLKVHFDNGKICYNLTDRAISREDIKDIKTRKNPWLAHKHPRLGTHHTEETKRKISEHHKSTGHFKGSNNPNFGKSPTDEVKEKNRLAHLGNKNVRFGKHTTIKQKLAVSLARSKSVTQINKSGEIVATFKNAREAEKNTNISYTSISGCCNNKRKTAGGFIWKFT
jgi:group I intron endonuclease